MTDIITELVEHIRDLRASAQYMRADTDNVQGAIGALSASVVVFWVVTL